MSMKKWRLLSIIFAIRIVISLVERNTHFWLTFRLNKRCHGSLLRGRILYFVFVDEYEFLKSLKLWQKGTKNTVNSLFLFTQDFNIMMAIKDSSFDFRFELSLKNQFSVNFLNSDFQKLIWKIEKSIFSKMQSELNVFNRTFFELLFFKVDFFTRKLIFFRNFFVTKVQSSGS